MDWLGPPQAPPCRAGHGPRDRRHRSLDPAQVRRAQRDDGSDRARCSRPRDPFEMTVRVSSMLVVVAGLLTAWAQGYPWLGLTTGWMLAALILSFGIAALVPTIFLPRGRRFAVALDGCAQRRPGHPGAPGRLRRSDRPRRPRRRAGRAGGDRGAHGPEALLTPTDATSPVEPAAARRARPVGAVERCRRSESRPPYVMSEMIAAEPAVAERLVHRLAKDPTLDARRERDPRRGSMPGDRSSPPAAGPPSTPRWRSPRSCTRRSTCRPAARFARSRRSRPLAPADRRRAAHRGLARGRHARRRTRRSPPPARPARRRRSITVGPRIAGRRPGRPRDPHRGAGPELVPHDRLPVAAPRGRRAGRGAARLAGSTRPRSAPSSTSAEDAHGRRPRSRRRWPGPIG